MDKKAVILAGIVVGLVGAGLAWLGNPPNMGLCVVCFTRDTAGALGLHRVATVQYLRPEIMGFLLGSCLAAASRREWRARGGSSPVLRFFLGMAVAIGALIFLGCPLRMVLRLAGGDLTALYGFAGFAAGVYVGVLYLRAGYSLGRSQPQPRVNRYLAPLFALALLLLLVTRPSFVFFSAKGPGSLHVAVPVGLVAGMVVGAAAQRTRLCMMGGIRDAILLRDFHLLSGFAALFVAALVANAALGRFHLGLANQPVAHADGLFNFLGMAGAGLGSVLLGGCPLRQFVLAGEGDQDALAAVLGFLVGAAVAHNFGLAASPAGVPPAGKVAALVVLVFLAVVAWSARERNG